MAVGGERIAAIGPGLLVLLGVAHEDTPEAADRLARRVLALRVFEDANRRLADALGERELLCVSQFTLLATTRKGNRPGFTEAARPEHAEPLYERFCTTSGAHRGRFGAKMEVALVNDGPLTLMLES